MATSAAENPFYRALNELLDENGVGPFAEDLCEEFYALSSDNQDETVAATKMRLPEAAVI